MLFHGQTFHHHRKAFELVLIYYHSSFCSQSANAVIECAPGHNRTTTDTWVEAMDAGRGGRWAFP